MQATTHASTQELHRESPLQVARDAPRPGHAIGRRALRHRQSSGSTSPTTHSFSPSPEHRRSTTSRVGSSSLRCSVSQQLRIAVAAQDCEATIALVVGLLALVIGAASAGYETITVGPSGDDFTGLLVLPAGLALIGIGLATLWRHAS